MSAFSGTFEGFTSLPVRFFDTQPHIRVFESRAELTTMPVEQHSRGEECETELFQDILDIPGVVAVVGHPYDVIVQRAGLYTWDEITQRVLNLLLAVNLIPMAPASEAKQ